MTQQQVTELLDAGYDCGQIVLLSAADKLGLSREEALKLAAGFGGGMFAGETCGAVVGAIIALGCRYGGDVDKKAECSGKVSELRKQFAEKAGSTMCREILGYDLTDPEQMKKILELNLLKTKCPCVVYDAIQILDAML